MTESAGLITPEEINKKIGVNHSTVKTSDVGGQFNQQRMIDVLSMYNLNIYLFDYVAYPNLII